MKSRAPSAIGESATSQRATLPATRISAEVRERPVEREGTERADDPEENCERDRELGAGLAHERGQRRTPASAPGGYSKSKSR